MIFLYEGLRMATRRIIGIARRAAAGFLLLPISITSADGILPADYPDAQLINEGRELFFNETFGGNGRSCGSCHPEDNNYTIDPAYIAKLPEDNALFIAEHVSSDQRQNPLAENFEQPELMRKLGLIMENTNGFQDLDNNYTMRSVPHMLAMRSSITPPSTMADDGTSLPPLERTGWSGDGSPVDEGASPALQGSLREFTVGAVRQHFTRSLNRQAGVDFRLPDAHELDAIEAFMLSLGRQDPATDINSYRMRDERAERGRLNYMGQGLANGIPCNACHFNGGANTDPDFDFPPDVSAAAFERSNRSFAPRVEELLDQPGDILSGGEQPFDDGFGRGSNLFNTPPVIEAADTGPFFHSNQVVTVEAMIAFYSSQRHLRNGEVLPAIVGLNGAQVANVGAFIRVLNADENARSAIQLIRQAREVEHKHDKKINLKIARSEINDAIEVLRAGSLHFSDAIQLFEMALKKIRHRRYSAAEKKLQMAREAMIRQHSI
jgi:cytochrome c peroxidase